jgi:hypothetical protein
MNAEYVAGLLRSAMDNLCGQDLALDSCERMYSASFRSEPYKLADLGTIEDWEKSKLIQDHAIKAYCSAFNLPMPVRSMFDCSDSYCNVLEMLLDSAMDWIADQGFIIDAETLVVDLCNYKGEGEGIALFQGNETLPVFKDKNSSFFQVNKLAQS